MSAGSENAGQKGKKGHPSGSSGATAGPARYRYDAESMRTILKDYGVLNLRRPDCLSEMYNSRNGVWHPELWLQAQFDRFGAGSPEGGNDNSRASSRASGRGGPTSGHPTDSKTNGSNPKGGDAKSDDGKKVAPAPVAGLRQKPIDRLKSTDKDKDLILSPQRRSFNDGCKIVAQSNSSRPGKATSPKPGPISGRFGSIHQHQGGGHQSHYGHAQHGAAPHNRRGGGESAAAGSRTTGASGSWRDRDRVSEGEPGFPARRHYDSRQYNHHHAGGNQFEKPWFTRGHHSHGQRRSSLSNQPEPEWFNDGPEDVNDTIELSGFADDPNVIAEKERERKDSAAARVAKGSKRSKSPKMAKEAESSGSRPASRESAANNKPSSGGSHRTSPDALFGLIQSAAADQARPSGGTTAEELLQSLQFEGGLFGGKGLWGPRDTMPPGESTLSSTATAPAAPGTSSKKGGGSLFMGKFFGGAAASAASQPTTAAAAPTTESDPRLERLPNGLMAPSSAQNKAGGDLLNLLTRGAAGASGAPAMPTSAAAPVKSLAELEAGLRGKSSPSPGANVAPSAGNAPIEANPVLQTLFNSSAAGQKPVEAAAIPQNALTEAELIAAMRKQAKQVQPASLPVHQQAQQQQQQLQHPASATTPTGVAPPPHTTAPPPQTAPAAMTVAQQQEMLKSVYHIRSTNPGSALANLHALGLQMSNAQNPQHHPAPAAPADPGYVSRGSGEKEMQQRQQQQQQQQAAQLFAYMKQLQMAQQQQQQQQQQQPAVNAVQQRLQDIYGKAPSQAHQHTSVAGGEHEKASMSANMKFMPTQVLKSAVAHKQQKEGEGSSVDVAALAHAMAKAGAGANNGVMPARTTDPTKLYEQQVAAAAAAARMQMMQQQQQQYLTRPSTTTPSNTLSGVTAEMLQSTAAPPLKGLTPQQLEIIRQTNPALLHQALYAQQQQYLQQQQQQRGVHVPSAVSQQSAAGQQPQAQGGSGGGGRPPFFQAGRGPPPPASLPMANQQFRMANNATVTAAGTTATSGGSVGGGTTAASGGSSLTPAFIEGVLNMYNATPDPPMAAASQLARHHMRTGGSMMSAAHATTVGSAARAGAPMGQAPARRGPAGQPPFGQPGAPGPVSFGPPPTGKPISLEELERAKLVATAGAASAGGVK